ncbi:hypothetical protein [Flavobacterium cheniae]|uniref:Uncharacterized protein n=1 Tax=Flavobacterium cheniae TaxID=295428 RepID=A0A562KJ77_9FLAO|nr:hypothetical protein [Flavobacterium cheniae]TDR25831.1 hypothetical protein C8D80_0620 [Flavobacterium cheniae]TWH95440.1 hypothetical protein IP97_01116 [Flavobacterium cheniae]
MKHYFLILISFLIISCEKDCKNLKIGTFELKGIDGTIHTIVRNEIYQTEYLNDSNIVVQYNIKWTSPCSYEIYNRKVLSNLDFNIEHQDTIRFEITEINGNVHKIISKFKDIDEVYENSLQKIK